jgi:hypothetical protein
VAPEGPRGQGFEGSSEMLRNYKEFNAWQKPYKLCLKIYRITAKFPNADKIFRKQTLEPLTPGILGSSSPTKLEKNQIILSKLVFVQWQIQSVFGIG